MGMNYLGKVKVVNSQNPEDFKEMGFYVKSLEGMALFCVEDCEFYLVTGPDEKGMAWVSCEGKDYYFRAPMLCKVPCIEKNQD